MELDNLFISLQDDKSRYLNAKTGTDFEERVLAYLQLEMGFSRILKADIAPDDWSAIKSHVGTKLGTEFLDVPDPRLRHKVIYMPYGSQMFPDLIVFTEHKVVPIEVKFSAQRQGKPIWNSNVPRANAFYIFGSYGFRDITFFCGDDVLAPKHRELLYSFFSDIRALQDQIRVTMPALDVTDRGFTPYIRAAFDQRKHKSSVETNFFSHPLRLDVEAAAIKRSSEL